MARTIKRSGRKTGAVKSTRKPAGESKPAKKSTAPAPEYQEYLERYAEFGEGRPRLSPNEFDKLDDELLDLLENAGGQLSDEQNIRLQELEYLLIDTE